VEVGLQRQPFVSIATSRLGAFAAAVALLSTVPALGLPRTADASPSTSLFTPIVGTMKSSRGDAAVAPLPNGEVLIAGGYNGSAFVDTAELFNPATATFSELAATTTTPRELAAVAPLPNGEVLIAGGYNGSNLETAELFNPATGMFSAVGAMLSTARAGAAAAPLPNGEVLIAGGGTGSTYLNTAALFNPATATFSELSVTMVSHRSDAVAAVLPNGEVLIAGGYGEGGSLRALDTAELFNPATGMFSAVRSKMTTPRVGAAAISLASGAVLIVGGEKEVGTRLRTAETFNPATAAFSELPAQLTATRVGAAAAPLPNGEVLIAGGGSNTAELFLSAPEAAFSGGAFGGEPVGQTSADQTITIANKGAQTLVIYGIALGGADPQAFTIAANACSGARLAFGQSCALTLSFTPKATGAQSALLRLEDNEERPAEIPLSGEGFIPAQGPTGPTGAQGPQGPTGRQGPPGKVEVLSCKAKKRVVKRHGRRRRVSIKRCSLMPLPSHFKLDGGKIVRLSRAGRTYALGRAGAGKITLRLRRPLQPGRYTLLLGFGSRARRLSVVVAAAEGKAH